jgi:RND family efflux transporter MFP subunit
MKHSFFVVLILAFFGAIIAALYIFQPKPETAIIARLVANVETLTVQAEDVKLTVSSQGTVMPQTESDLAIEVSGRVIAVAENFRPGGSFKKGDILLEVDPLDYEAMVATRLADLARAKLALAQEEALAKQAQMDWRAVSRNKDKNAASPLALRLPQLEVAHATVKSTTAALKKAENDLANTKVRAPFDGKVLKKNIDLGQLVTVNSPNVAARIYATEAAEIRLPITERESQFLPNLETNEAPVVLKYNERTWIGRLVRIEATIEPKSRLLYAVAQVDDPFKGPAPMRRGLFVEAKIEGKTIEKAYKIPRYAIRGNNTVYILTKKGTLETREVVIVKNDARFAIISSGLTTGEKVAISPIAYFAEGMPVNVINE